MADLKLSAKTNAQVGQGTGGGMSFGTADMAAVLGGIGNAVNQYASIHDAKEYTDRLGQFQLNPDTGVSSLSAAKNAWLSYNPLKPVTSKDMGYNQLSQEASILGSVAQGIGTGQGYAGLINGITGLVGMIASERKATKQANIVNKKINSINQYNQNILSANIDRARDNTLNNAIMNSQAYGGPINMVGTGVMSPFGSRFAAGGPLHAYGSDWSNGLIFVNSGGSHEQNPNEGVQMGIDPQGIPNLVEEGEVIYNDYVFSNRMKVPKKDKIKYKLGGLKLTYAEAAKKAQKESEERPNDPISKRGLEWIMAKLAESQETMREKEYMKEVNRYAKELGVSPEELLAMVAQQQGQQQQVQPMQQPMMAAYGGSIYIKPSKRGTFTAAASKHGKSVQEFASQVLANKDNYSPAMVKKANFAKNAAGWKHGLGGNLFLPGGLMWTYNIPFNNYNPRIRERETEDGAYWLLGDRLQGYLPGGSDYSPYTGQSDLSNWQSKITQSVYRPEDDINAQEEKINKDAEAWRNTSNLYEFLSRYNPTVAQMQQSVSQPITLPSGIELPKYKTFEQRVIDDWNAKYKAPIAEAPVLSNGNDNKTEGAVTTGNRNYDWTTGLRYLGPLSNLADFFVNSFRDVDYSRANEVAKAYNAIPDISVSPNVEFAHYKPYDIRDAATRAGQQAASTRRAIANIGGGNRGASIAGVLMANNDLYNGLGRTIADADQQNYARYLSVLDTNNKLHQWLTQTDLAVQEANQKAQEARARGIVLSREMMDRYDAAKAAALQNSYSAGIQGLTDIGREQFIMNQVNDSNPLYKYRGSDGHIMYAGSDAWRESIAQKYLSKDDFEKFKKAKVGSQVYKDYMDKILSMMGTNTSYAANGGYLTIKRRRK